MAQTYKAPLHGWAVDTRRLDGFEIFKAPARRIYRAAVDVGDIIADAAG